MKNHLLVIDLYGYFLLTVSTGATSTTYITTIYYHYESPGRSICGPCCMFTNQRVLVLTRRKALDIFTGKCNLDMQF